MSVNTTLLYFLLLIPVSGLIALVGDRIGYRMGKRRHSLLGLRPRHTAMVFTIGSGMGISLLTFLLMYASSETFRDVLARGAQLKRTNEALERRNAALTAASAQADQRIAALNEAAKKARQERTVAEKARTEALSRQAEAERKTEQAARALKAAETRLESERSRLGATQTALTAAEAQVQEARTRLERATDASRVARAETSRAQGEARRAQERAQEASRELEVARERIAAANRTFETVRKFQAEKLAEQRSRIARQTTQLFAQKGKLEEQSRQLFEQSTSAERRRLEVARLTEEVAELEAKRAESQRLLAQVASSAKALRDSRIIYRVGEEVDRISIAPTNSVYRVQNRLEALLTTGGKKAEARGAARGGDLARAVVIPTRTDGSTTMTETDVLREVSGAVRKAGEDVVVVLLCAENAVAGEPVRADMRILRNPLVFKAGTSLGEILLPDTRVRQDTADRLYTFLSGEVREKLLRAGVIPPVLGDDSERSLVTLSGDEWLSLLDDARQAGWRARVTVRCAQDLRAADPVRLTFEIKGLPVTAVAEQNRRP